MTSPFEIFFEDQHLIVLSKAPGVLSQGDVSGDQNLVDLLRAHFGRSYVGTLHRLDRNTSGLMVFAKRSKAAERLTSALQNGELIRKYHALLWGELKTKSPEPMRLEHWLLKNEKTNETKIVAPKVNGAKQALLHLQPLKTFAHPKTGDLITSAEFTLETGRSHQIRAQTNAIGHPLIGDHKYGNAKSLALFSRPALHSCFLSFPHPMSKEWMTFEQRYYADMIENFSTALE
ncbi:MAG: RluA family pseudouridine synthase [Bdellovibrionales bacterium]|nr:RluA family pseudouridine synthase [Bdellovibrionales bacterium]